MIEEEVLFEEKQHLGYNKQSMVSRTILALFCFLAYYWSENPKPLEVSGVRIGSYPVQNIENSGQLFFILGVIILLSSVVFTFLVHLHTVVNPAGIDLTGLWTSRKVRIEFSNLVSVRKIRYRKNFSGRPAYNLHSKGHIRFYTRGNEWVEVTDKNGMKYRIGSQRAGELEEIIKKFI